ncbi:polynucleotide adenylyltransferase [Allomyces arbusculus]|nr:polynucleotide adenylyltransferase [Allomyces arbusculus]
MAMTTSVPLPASLQPPATALPAVQQQMAKTPDQFLGITQPIPLVEPTATEQELTAQLVETLRENGMIEPTRSKTVLGRINILTKRFVKQVGMRRGLTEELAEEAGGTIFTFGPFRLGNFFLDMLEMHKNEPDVAELVVRFLLQFPRVGQDAPERFIGRLPLRDAYQPAIKVKLMGMLLPQVLGDVDLSDNNLLLNQGEYDLRAMNATRGAPGVGPRVTNEIARLVHKITGFRTTLWCVKLWAKPTASTLVSKVFNIVFKWQWPQPVQFKPMQDGSLNVRIWSLRVRR